MQKNHENCFLLTCTKGFYFSISANTTYVSASSLSDRFTITVDLAEQKRSLRIANTSLADFHLVKDAVNRLLSGKF